MNKWMIWGGKHPYFWFNTHIYPQPHDPWQQRHHPAPELVGLHLRGLAQVGFKKKETDGTHQKRTAFLELEGASGQLGKHGVSHDIQTTEHANSD